MTRPNIIILAAGESTRLKSGLTKVMHPICGRPMIDYVLEAARSLKPAKIALVVGNHRETLQDHLGKSRGLIFAHQRQRLGTAHAAGVGLKALQQKTGPVLILNGDVPLIQAATLRNLMQAAKGRALSLLSAVLPNPFGYGRILRDHHGEVQGIIEEKNASATQRQINEINAGVYVTDAAFLGRALQKIPRDPVKKEFYLTEIVRLARQAGKGIAVRTVQDTHEVLGVNTRSELAFLNQMVQSALVAEHLQGGVGMEDPDRVYVDYGVKIGEDSFLAAGVHLKGRTRLGKGVRVEPGCIVQNTQLADGVQLRAYSYLEDCKVGTDAVIGPFARIRPQSSVGAGAKVGNFVELKKATLGAKSKANHLSYLGDAKVGRGANIGAGTITCNYDGKKKYQTTIGDQVFIGSDTQLVAPVKVGKGAYIGAGTTVTKNVPPGALAVSRVEQKNIRKRTK